MFPFWDAIVAPILRAREPHVILEIGALRGDSTLRLLDELASTTELHVIDPMPQFDPTHHEQQFAGRYVFHRALSVDAIVSLPPVDLALIDGDHNWFTVHTELTQLEAAARRGGRCAPVFVLHDVAWPYGRRDGYYNRDTVPDEHRQPCAQRGIVRGRSELGADGINAHIWNAEHEGGARNGVLTAAEDFVAANEGRFRLEVFDIFVGLAVIVEHALLVELPALGAVLDGLASAEFAAELREKVLTEARAARRTP